MGAYSIRYLLAVVLTVLVPVSASAQTGEPAGPVRRLSIDEAVSLALEQNLGIQIQRIEPRIQDVGIAQARSLWTPNLTSSVTRNAVNQPASSAISPRFQNGTISNTVGFNQVLPWGGSLSATWNNSRLMTTNIFNDFSPQLQSQIQLNYTQPLLRNYKIDQIRQQVQISHKLRDLSDIQVQAVITQTMRAVRDAYWDLVYAHDNVAAQRQSLELAQQSLHDSEKRVQIGILAPIDIVQAQAEVAANQQSVIVADAAIRTAEDRLRALVFDPSMPDFWTMTLLPTDIAPFEVQRIDLDAAVRNALENRTDLAQAKNSLDQGDISLRYLRNQILPDVNAQVTYGAIGIGGSQLEPLNPFDLSGGIVRPRTVLTQRSYGSVLGDVIQSTYPQWSVGLQIAYPIGSSTAEANLARARLQYQEAQTQLRNLQLQIVTQVREVARQVQTNEERVNSARTSRELQERKLEAEEKKFAAGMSTSFFVFQAQRDLAKARTLEIQARSDYNKSLVDFDAVQLVPLAGSTAGMTTVGTGPLQTGGNANVRR